MTNVPLVSSCQSYRPPFAVGSGANGGMPSAASDAADGHAPRIDAPQLGFQQPFLQLAKHPLLDRRPILDERLERQQMPRRRAVVAEGGAVGRQTPSTTPITTSIADSHDVRKLVARRGRPHLDAADGAGRAVMARSRRRRIDRAASVRKKIALTASTTAPPVGTRNRVDTPRPPAPARNATATLQIK